MSVKYTNLQIQEALDLYDTYQSKRSVANKLGIPRTTVTRWVASREDKGGENNEHVTPEFPDLKTSNIHWTEYLEHADQAAEFRRKTHTSQERATVKLDTGNPICVLYSGDWHLGSCATDYKAWRQMLDTILETDGVYVCTVGDEIDNFTQFMTMRPVLDQVLSPREQSKVLAGVFDDLISAGKVLAACWGNHTSERTEKGGGFDMMEELAANKVPYFGGKGILDLRVGGQSYSHLMTHKSRFNSSHDPLHSCRKEFQLTYPARVVVCAHTHNPDFCTNHQYKTDGIFIKTGTHKIFDEYSTRYWQQGRKDVPSAVFYPDRDKLVPFKNMDDALIYRRGI